MYSIFVLHFSTAIFGTIGQNKFCTGIDDTDGHQRCLRSHPTSFSSAKKKKTHYWLNKRCKQRMTYICKNIQGDLRYGESGNSRNHS